MIRKILSFSLVIALLVVAGTACKKQDGEAGDKPYISDEPSGPLGGTVPDPDEDKDPCLAKGAVGAQALLLKADCPKLNPPKCGDGNTDKDKGEECDDGAKNGLVGSLCDIKCKNVTGETDVKPGDSTVTVKITNTKKMADGKLGVEYSATLTASGANSAKYKWSTEDIPDGFAATPNKGKLTIKGKTDVASDEPYKPIIKVCEEGSDVNCVTCPETICSFSIKDQYRIEAYPLPYKNKDDVATCSSDKTVPCNYELKAGGPIFTALNNKGENDPYYVLQLQVKDGITLKSVFAIGSEYNDPDVGYAKTYDDLYYKWSMTVDGKPTPTPFVKWMDYISKTTLDAVAADGLFLMDATDDMKTHLVYPGIAYIMVGPKAMGKEFKNVVVTVTSKNGGTQVIKFDSIKTSAVTAIATAVETKKADDCTKAPELKIDSVTMAGGPPATSDTSTPVENQSVFVFENTVDAVDTVKMNQDYKLTMNISGGLGNYTISPVSSDVIVGAEGHDPKHVSYYVVAKGSDGKIKYHNDATGMPVPDYEGKSGWHTVNETIATKGKSWEIVGDTYYINAVGDEVGQITETFNVDVGDSQCANSKKTAVIKIKTAFSKPEYVTDLKMVYINVKTEWTESGSSKLNIQLMSGSNVLAETGDFSAQLGSNDPSSIAGNFSLKNYGCVAGTDSCKIGKITAIRIHANDPSSVCGWSFWQCVTYDMTYDFTELRLVSDHFVAKSTTQVSGQCAGTCNNDTYTLKSFVGAVVKGGSTDTTGIWHKK